MPWLPSPIRRRSAALAIALVAAMLPFASLAQYPDKPIRIVVPFPAGGTPDILARILGEHVGKTLKQPVIIDNRGGAGGNIGAQAVKQAPADGYTLLMCAFGCSVSPALYQPKPFDIAKDFDPVIHVGTVPSVLVVNPAVPAKNLQELLAYAKSHPNKLNAASSGIGSSAHLAIVLLKTKAGSEVTHVAYRGAGQVAADLLAGQVDMYFDNLPASLQSIRAGKLRALAVASRERSPAAPNVPTFAEAGLPDFLITPWFGLMTPAHTPKDAIARLNQAFNQAMKDPGVAARLTELGVVSVGGSPDVLARFIGDESRTWSDIISKNGIKAE